MHQVRSFNKGDRIRLTCNIYHFESIIFEGAVLTVAYKHRCPDWIVVHWNDDYVTVPIGRVELVDSWRSGRLASRRIITAIDRQRTAKPPFVVGDRVVLRDVAGFSPDLKDAVVAVKGLCTRRTSTFFRFSHQGLPYTFNCDRAELTHRRRSRLIVADIVRR